jgi:hypothetical protein
MTDVKGMSTLELLKLVGNENRQAAEKQAAGYKRTTVWIHQGAWQAGYDAGLAGAPSTPSPPDLDGLSWISGYIEGQAKRQQ